MTKKIFLTSMITMCIAMPAFAEPSHTGTFPSGGLMQADYTYTNAATSTNMDGVYEGTVNANAQYTTNNYTVTAGHYLPADSEDPDTTCTAGNFCPGLQNTVQYSATNNQGLETCPSGYGNSAPGASANTECYRTCAIANNGTTFTNIAHATAVSGNDYYNTTATDTCEPTACENGWHVKPGGVDLTTIIGVTEAGTGYTANDFTGSENSSFIMSNTIIANDPMAFAVDYGNGKGVIKGHGRCSKTGVTTPWNETQEYTFAADHFVNNLTNETDPETGGQYCYCQLDSYTASGSNTSIALSTPWVFDADIYGVDYCANLCANDCANILQNNFTHQLPFRAAVFGAVESSPAMCEANTITINWGDTDAADVTANNAGTATYGGDIRTPVKAQTKKGKTFTGWLFSKPTQQSGN